jgi:hypothetical protein
MTFREKSTITQIVAILLVYGFLAAHYWDHLTRDVPVGLLVGVILFTPLIVAPLNIAFAIYKKPEKPDERDAFVNVRGMRNGYAVLGTGLWAILIMIMQKSPYGLLFCAVLALFTVAELVRLGSQLYYYRFGS